VENERGKYLNIGKGVTLETGGRKQKTLKRGKTFGHHTIRYKKEKKEKTKSDAWS